MTAPHLRPFHKCEIGSARRLSSHRSISYAYLLRCASADCELATRRTTAGCSSASRSSRPMQPTHCQCRRSSVGRRGAASRRSCVSSRRFCGMYGSAIVGGHGHALDAATTIVATRSRRQPWSRPSLGRQLDRSAWGRRDEQSARQRRGPAGSPITPTPVGFSGTRRLLWRLVRISQRVVERAIPCRAFRPR
jgi:hypothetical protein